MILRFFRKITGGHFGLFISFVAVLVAAVTVHIVSASLPNRLQDQHMAERWGSTKEYSHISCFFSREAAVSDYTFQNFEFTLMSSLREASITADDKAEGARLFIDTYSETGKVSIEGNRTTISVNAIGVKGDFFQFHPIKLLSGSYFSGDSVMTDYLVVDEVIAWQLFGSVDIAGQYVTIGGVPHMITGVVERSEDKLTQAAGLSQPTCYLSSESLNQYGTSYGINTYEIVMPNPVPGFALEKVKDGMGLSEVDMEIVENTTRFGLLERFKVLGSFGKRSMSTNSVIYPYWENIARGYEDYLALLLFCDIIMYLYVLVLFVISFIGAWRRRTWSFKGLFRKAADAVRIFMERRREAKKHALDEYNG